MTVTLRPLMREDAPTLAQLEQLCFSAPRSQAQLEREAENPLGRFVVAVLDTGAIAGYAGMQCICDEAYVENIAVFPAYRGQGIGRALTCRLIDTAREEACAFLTLEVRPSNTAAVSLYESLGFRAVGRRKNFYTQPTEDGLLMTLFFAAAGEECETNENSRN